MVPDISWSNQVPVSKDHSMWGGILLENCIFLVIFYLFYTVVKVVYDLILKKDFGFLWLLQNFSLLGIVTPFFTFWQILFISNVKCDVLYTIDEEGLESLSFLSYIGMDDGGVEVNNHYTSSRFLTWKNVRKVKIYEKTHVIFVKGLLIYLPVTLHCTSYIFEDAANFIKNHIDPDKILEFQ